MRSNFLLYFIYQFLKLISRIALALFYPYTRVTGRRNLHLEGPTLLATNHPNTMIDALNSAGRVDELVFFLAHASLFKGTFQGWFFNTFFCIPIERRQDAEGRPLNNQAAFARADAHLEKGGHLFVAPEGSSFLERRLRPLKTGISRIALSAESKNNFNLKVRILPVCLNYDRANKFGSRLLVNVGDPIFAADFAGTFQADPRQAVREMTEQLEDRMRKLLIDTHSPEEDRLVRHLEIVIDNEHPVDQATHFHRTKGIIAALRRWKQEAPHSRTRFEEETAEYFRLLADYRLTDKAVGRAMHRQQVRRWEHLLALVPGFLLFVYGFVNNFLPYYIPKLILQRLKLDVEYEATFKMLAGLITFPLFYALQTWLVADLLPWPFPFVYFVSLIPLGYFAHWFPSFFRRVRAQWHWESLDDPERESLLQARRTICHWLENVLPAGRATLI